MNGYNQLADGNTAFDQRIQPESGITGLRHENMPGSERAKLTRELKNPNSSDSLQATHYNHLM